MTGKRFLLGILIFLSAIHLPSQSRYMFRYKLKGHASSRVLFFIPVHVYYESSTSVFLRSTPSGEGSLRYRYDGIVDTAFILRTLGFSGREMVLLYADDRDARRNVFPDGKIADWTRETPEYSSRVARFHRYPYRVKPAGAEAVQFLRSASGVHSQSRQSLQCEPLFGFRHSIYFNFIPMMALLISFYNHSFLPPGGLDSPSAVSWESPPLDYTRELNRAGALMEKIISEWVTLQQNNPFRLRYQYRKEGGDIYIEGIAYPYVPIWKGFCIKTCRRLVHLRIRNRQLLSDEISLDIRDKDGDGGYGKMELKFIE